MVPCITRILGLEKNVVTQNLRHWDCSKDSTNAKITHMPVNIAKNCVSRNRVSEFHVSRGLPQYTTYAKSNNNKAIKQTVCSVIVTLKLQWYSTTLQALDLGSML